MSDFVCPSPGLDAERFHQTHAGVRAAKNRLPKDAVIVLAQEVLKRVSERASVSGALPSDEVRPRIELLAHALISDDPNDALNYARDLQISMKSAETMYLTYLGGAAQLLGEWWERSLVSFVDVTVGTSRIYSIMLSIRSLFPSGSAVPSRSALLASVPGENHTLGVTMVADLLRKDGWDIDLQIGLSHEELVRHVEASKLRLVGLSCAGHHSIPALARLIVALRLSKPSSLIVVSGHIVDDAHDIVLGIGADELVGDYGAAKQVLEKLWINGSQ